METPAAHDRAATVERWVTVLKLVLLCAAAASIVAAAACESAGDSAVGSKSPGSAAAPSAAPSPTGDPNIPDAEAMAMLYGRRVAWMDRRYDEAAAYYTTDAVMREMDLDPDAVTVGRAKIARRLGDLYGLGLRFGTAGLPLQYGRYVAEPVVFFNPTGETAPGMLVFELDPSGRIARQFAMGDLGRAAPTTPETGSPSPIGQVTSRPNAPTVEAMHVLQDNLEDLDYGDGAAAAELYAAAGRLWEMNRNSVVVAKGRDEISAHVNALGGVDGIFRGVEAAGMPVQYDRYVVQPVQFAYGWQGGGDGVLFYELDVQHQIANLWIIAEVRE